MPIKLPANTGVLSVHRPDLMKKILPPSSKDEQLAGTAAQEKARPRTHRPLFQLSPVTPYNNYPSVAKVNAAIKGEPLFTTQPQVVAALRQHLDHHLPVDTDRPVVVVIGELHGTDVALLESLTVLHRLRMFRSKQLLVELAPESMQAGLGSIDGAVDELKQCVASPGVSTRRRATHWSMY